MAFHFGEKNKLGVDCVNRITYILVSLSVLLLYVSEC
jgi:hypothetical protein